MPPAGRLLMVVNHLGFFFSHRQPIARAALAAGYELHLAADPADADPRAVPPDVAFHPVPFARAYGSPRAEAATIAGLRRVARAEKIDLLHAFGLKPALASGLAIVGLPRVRPLYSLTGLGHLFTARGLAAAAPRTVVLALLSLLFRREGSFVTFQNRDDLQDFLRRGVVRGSRARVFRGTGIDLDVFRPPDSPPSDLLVLFPSRMLRSKGVHDFVDAARVLRSEGCRARFVLAGAPDPANPDSLSEEQLRRWADSGDVEWWGQRRDMPDVLRRASVVCLPSWYREGVPRALLEAAAAGLPIVTCAGPGCREVVDDGVNGVLVPPRDPRSLTDALRRLLDDSGLRERMGRASRERARRDFDERQAGLGVLDLYRSLRDGR